MEVVINSVPVESPGAKLLRKRSESCNPIMPKIAITSLNHWAVKNGFPSCKFYDIDMLYPSDADIEKYFSENKADVVGLRAVVSTSYLQVKRISKIIKKVNKHTLIICGGYLTAAANTILRKTEVDVCVVGDGEIAWVGILKFMKEHLETGKNKLDIDKLLKVKGIAILDENEDLRFSGYGQTLASCHMMFPSYEYLKSGLLGDKKAVQNYFRPFDKHEAFIMDERSFEKGRRPMVTSIFLSKGCVAKCTFCQRGAKGYSVYDLSKLEAYIKDLKDNHNVGFLVISDENFGSNKKYTYQAVELMNKYGMLWAATGIRVSSVTKEDLLFYKNNGCTSMKFGIESGSQTMLDVMEKKFQVEDIKKALFACHDIGLNSPPLGFMLGMPGESLKTAKESGKLMGEIAAHLKIPTGLIFKHNDLLYTIPLIGTPVYEYGKQLGLIGQSTDEEEKFLEITSNVGAYKRYYINFNGAPMSEVVFWDMLVFLEATKTYGKLMKSKTENDELKKKYINAHKVQALNPHIKAKQKKVKKIEVMGASTEINVSISQYFVTNFVKEHIVFNRIIAKLPRFLVYPIVRYALYFEYLIQKKLFKDSNNLHTVTNKKVNSKIRVKHNELDPSKTTQKDRSLRTIVAKKMLQLDRTEQAKLVSSITGGP